MRFVVLFIVDIFNNIRILYWKPVYQYNNKIKYNCNFKIIIILKVKFNLNFCCVVKSVTLLNFNTKTTYNIII